MRPARPGLDRADGDVEPTRRLVVRHLAEVGEGDDLLLELGQAGHGLAHGSLLGALDAQRLGRDLVADAVAGDALAAVPPSEGVAEAPGAAEPAASMDSLAAATTASVVMPNSRYSVLKSAEAP